MIEIKHTASGRPYRLGELRVGHHQYIDRLYQFAYVPEELAFCPHVMTFGDDKMIPEDEPCFTVEVSRPCDVYILYPDKQPVLPQWLDGWERTRMNVTRIDSLPMNLKGYFSLYKKSFPADEITFYGNSPRAMLAEDWYVETLGNNYCMYTAAIRER